MIHKPTQNRSDHSARPSVSDSHSFLFVDVRPAFAQPEPINALHHLGLRLLGMLTGNAPVSGWQAWSETSLETRLTTDLSGFSQWGGLSIEAATTANDRNVDENQVRDLLQQLDRICTEANGIWQLRSQNRLGCLIPGYAAPDLAQMATALQETSRPAIKLTIGMAVVPTLDYPPITLPANAEKALEHALLLGAGQRIHFDAISLNVAGDKLYADGNIEAARDEFKQALLLDPQDTNILNSLGVCYGMLGQYPQARTQFEKALAVDRKEAMAHFNLGMLALLEKEPEAATRALQKAASFLDLNRQTAIQIGRAFLQAGRPDLAQAHLQGVVRQNPAHGIAMGLLGQVWYELGDPQKAKPLLQKALRQTPNDAASLSTLAALMADQGKDLPIAVMYGQQSVALAPQNGLFRKRLGCLFLKENDFVRALSEFEVAQRLGHATAKEIETAKAALNTQVPN